MKNFILRAKKQYRVKEAYLFGSRARGDWLKRSDYDVIFVSPDFEGKFFTKRISEVYRRCGVRFDLEVLCYTPGEFDRMRRGINIVSHALKHAIRLA